MTLFVVPAGDRQDSGVTPVCCRRTHSELAMSASWSHAKSRLVFGSGFRKILVVVKHSAYEVRDREGRKKAAQSLNLGRALMFSQLMMEWGLLYCQPTAAELNRKPPQQGVLLPCCAATLVRLRILNYDAERCWLGYAVHQDPVRQQRWLMIQNVDYLHFLA